MNIDTNSFFLFCCGELIPEIYPSILTMAKMRTAYRILLRKAVRESPPGDFGI
jgi:hypothetical protein